MGILKVKFRHYEEGRSVLHLRLRFSKKTISDTVELSVVDLLNYLQLSCALTVDHSDN